MISPREAQELHELIGGALETLSDAMYTLSDVYADSAPVLSDLRRARELAALIVADLDA